MMKFIFVDRRQQEKVQFHVDGLRQMEPYALAIKAFDSNSIEPAIQGGTCFMAHERDVDVVVLALAKAHPGKEVTVWSMESAGVCPPAEFVQKKVTKDGILPV